jgi:inhibitor of cysteine peptidase
MGKETIILFTLFVVVTVFGVVGFSFMLSNSTQSPNQDIKLEKFNSDNDFKSFIESDPRPALIVSPNVSPNIAFETSMTSGDDTKGTSGGYETRQTNTQIKGIDEPDIVKLTRDAAYYSPTRRYFIPIIEPGGGSDLQHMPQSRTWVFDTNNTKDPKIISEINQSGQMLREDNNMVIYNSTKIKGYDVSDGNNPVINWDKTLPNNSEVESARSMNGQLYLVIKSYDNNCPIKSVKDVKTNCQDIYHPVELDSGDSVYSILSVNIETGQIDSKTSIVGSYGSSFYMSEDNMYISYEKTDLDTKTFVKENIDDIKLNDAEKTELLNRIENRSVSSIDELEEILYDIDKNRTKYSIYDNSNINTLYDKYVEENQRNISRTIIVRLQINNGDISPKATGSVPGHPLNQYSFDEYNDKLRIATTVKGLGQSESLNDMYVLNKNLEVQGSVQDMAEGQRVYSVRFIGEKGYIITFRQIDPLHVINIEDPHNPEEVGTLELPGFSDYLHKIGDNELLGIGESSDRKGKVVLFDVSDETNPKVADSIIFENESQTEISNNFRSFLKDDKNNVIYIPANNGVHVLKYEKGDIEEIKMIHTNGSADRVRILGEDLFIFHSNGVLSVDRDSYAVNGEFEFEDYRDK